MGRGKLARVPLENPRCFASNSWFLTKKNDGVKNLSMYQNAEC